MKKNHIYHNECSVNKTLNPYYSPGVPGSLRAVLPADLPAVPLAVVPAGPEPPAVRPPQAARAAPAQVRQGVINKSSLNYHNASRFAKVAVASRDGDFTARLQVLLPPGYRDEDNIAFPTLFEV